SNSSADCYERGPAIFGVRVAPAHDGPRSGPNSSKRESTSSRSTDYASGNLIRVFRGIGRIFSLLFPLNHPSPVGHQLMGKVQNRKTEYDFVEGKNGFICVSSGTFTRCPSPKREPRPRGSGARLRFDNASPDKRFLITPAASS